MASYGIYVVDDGNGSFTINKLMRAPTSVTISGGTSLIPIVSGGGPVGTTTGYTPCLNVSEMVAKCMAIVQADRSYVG